MAIIERLGSFGFMVLAAFWLAKNVVTPLVNSHTGLIEQLRKSDITTSATLETMADAQNQQGNVLSQQAEVLVQQAKSLEQMTETQREISRILETLQTR
jgi:hypothetical protein